MGRKKRGIWGMMSGMRVEREKKVFSTITPET
jgi:hypothetical protein